MALPDEVIEFGTLRRVQRIQPSRTIGFQPSEAGRIKDLAKETQKGSPQAFASIGSKCYSQQAIEGPLSKTSLGWNFSRRNMNF